MTREDLFIKDIQTLTEVMEKKFDQNHHKGTWEKMDSFELIHLLILEVNELYKEIRDQDDKNIMLEAADIANFAMMIVGNAKRRLEQQKA